MQRRGLRNGMEGRSCGMGLMVGGVAGICSRGVADVYSGMMYVKS